MTTETPSLPYILEPGGAREDFQYGGSQLRYLVRAADTGGRITRVVGPPLALD